ncbi:MAG: hypothetical protein M3Y87_02765 [Myxococcota bacterium]|nr:hypothetical protein [Myxococcota bacterium]
MKDTPADVEARYRAMLAALSPEERLRMGARMVTTSRALVRASIVAELGPGATHREIRRRMLLRFYGRELAPEVAETVLRRISDT